MSAQVHMLSPAYYYGPITLGWTLEVSTNMSTELSPIGPLNNKLVHIILSIIKHIDKYQKHVEVTPEHVDELRQKAWKDESRCSTSLKLHKWMSIP